MPAPFPPSGALSADLSPSVVAALTDARSTLETLYGDRLAGVLLYGSHARGEAGPDSDVDVLVLLHGKVDVYAETKRVSALRLRLLLDYEEDVSIQPYTAADYAERITPFLTDVHTHALPL